MSFQECRWYSNPDETQSWPSNKNGVCGDSRWLPNCVNAIELHFLFCFPSEYSVMWTQHKCRLELKNTRTFLTCVRIRASNREHIQHEYNGFCRWRITIRIARFMHSVDSPEFYAENSRKNVSETESDSVLRWWGGTYSVGPLRWS